MVNWLRIVVCFDVFCRRCFEVWTAKKSFEFLSNHLHKVARLICGKNYVRIKDLLLLWIFLLREIFPFYLQTTGCSLVKEIWKKNSTSKLIFLQDSLFNQTQFTEWEKWKPKQQKLNNESDWMQIKEKKVQEVCFRRTNKSRVVTNAL